jgi:hypothetical protein
MSAWEDPMKRLTTIAALALAGTVTLGLAAANAEMVKYKVNLTPAMEVPPTKSDGKGTADVTFDTATKKLTWEVTYSGLTGPATAAHFHSPAAAGANAPPTVPLSGNLASPIKGEATLTDAQAKDLADGKMYFNIHTAANGGGEIRGQVVK